MVFYYVLLLSLSRRSLDCPFTNYVMKICKLNQNKFKTNKQDNSLGSNGINSTENWLIGVWLLIHISKLKMEWNIFKKFREYFSRCKFLSSVFHHHFFLLMDSSRWENNIQCRNHKIFEMREWGIIIILRGITLQ